AYCLLSAPLCCHVLEPSAVETLLGRRVATASGATSQILFLLHSCLAGAKLCDGRCTRCTAKDRLQQIRCPYRISPLPSRCRLCLRAGAWREALAKFRRYLSCRAY